MASSFFSSSSSGIMVSSSGTIGTSIATEMTRRRENEARLFEQGLAATPMAAQGGLEAAVAGLEAAAAPAAIPPASTR